jgi:acyl-ACP thioesterase
MKPPSHKAASTPGAPWTEAFTVRGYETDPQGRLSVLSLCRFFQEAAANHAGALGVGLDDLNEKNLTWMLSRLRLWLDRLPAAGDPVTVATWPSGADRLFAWRDFAVSGADGATVAVADSAWLVIDRDRRRPARIEPFLERLRSGAGDPLLDKPIPKLPSFGTGGEGRRFSVRGRDLDQNRHVNNVAYVEWFLESLGPDFLLSRAPVYIAVEYSAEALAGDVVFAARSPVPDQPGVFSHGVIRQSDGRELARARTEWREK